MYQMLYYLIDACAVAFALACIARLRAGRKRSKSLRLPPGPKRLPLIGNLLDMQDPEGWEVARKWQEEYGPIISVEVLGTPAVFVNSYEAAVEMFERRGHKYSSRPVNAMFDLEGWDWPTPMMPYGDELKRSRQLLHRFLQPNVMKDYTELLSQAIHRMLDRLLRDPDDYSNLVRLTAGETIIFMAYGFQVQGKDDPYLEIAERGVQVAVEAEHFFLVNFFPSLQYLPSWIPGTGFKKIAEEGRKIQTILYNAAYEFATSRLTEGLAAPSMMSKLQDSFIAGDPVISEEALIKKVTGTVYGASTDTETSALSSFFLAMLLYPEVQKRAQDELDRIVGKDTLPTLEDRPNLPYLNAVVKETLRWQPVTPLAIAHTADEDDEFNGYLIPKGTIIWPNIWAILRDPKEYPVPEEFIPERWLPSEGKQPPLDVYKTFFGFGRRMCPGRHLADNMVFLGAASILAVFNITKALDENGIPIAPKVEYTPHFVRHPKPFKYKLTPRSDKIESVVHQAVEAGI